MTIRTCTVETPTGPWRLASDGSALVAIGMRNAVEAFRSELARRTGETFGSGTDKVLEQARWEVQEYFAGKRRSFDVPTRFAWGTPFQRKVWKAIGTIPFGETRTYGWLAEKVGSPGGFQAAGQATGANPLALIVPCHRILQSTGRLGGYGGGEDVKRALLEHEGAAFRP